MFFEDVPTDKKSSIFDFYGHTHNFQTITDKSSREGLVQLNCGPL